MVLEPLTAPVAVHGEGALWSPAQDLWISVDMLAGALVLTDDAGSSRRIQLPDDIAAFVRPVVGSPDLLAAGERTLWRIDTSVDPAVIVPVDDVAVRPGCRVNEGGCAPDGSLYVGTMAYDERLDGGTVELRRADGSWTTCLATTSISNGLVMPSPEVALFVDSPTKVVASYSVDRDGGWYAPTTWCDLTTEAGAPDGVCLDAAGDLWVAMWGGGVVLKLSRGRVVERLAVPVAYPTSVALGGPDGNRLLVTSSRLPVDAHDDELAGGLFVATVDVPGAIVHAWAPA